MSDNQDLKIKFKYVFPDDYNPVYANGVWGGFTPKGELNMNFFHERFAVPRNVTCKINEDGTLGGEVERNPEDPPMIRYVTAGVVMGYAEAKAVHAWIGELLCRSEEQLKIANTKGVGDEQS